MEFDLFFHREEVREQGVGIPNKKYIKYKMYCFHHLFLFIVT